MMIDYEKGFVCVCVCVWELYLIRNRGYRKVDNESRFPISFAFFSQFVLSVLCSTGSIDDQGSIFVFRPRKSSSTPGYTCWIFLEVKHQWMVVQRCASVDTYVRLDLECNLRRAQMKSLQLYRGIDNGSAALLVLLSRSLVAIALRHWLHPTNCEWDETIVDFSLQFFQLNWSTTLARLRTPFADKVEWRPDRWDFSLSLMMFSIGWHISGS